MCYIITPQKLTKGLCMKNILITGANGQLGTELSHLIPDAVLTDYKDLDITNEASVDTFVKKNKIETILNCAAYTAVDAAEDDWMNATKINAKGPAILAKTGCKLVHISTDYVFDGTYLPHDYTPDDTPNPLSVYGATKLMGENAVLANSNNSIIIRTSWLYSPYGKNFVKTMRNLGTTKKEISVVDDQFGLPTYAADLADAIVQIVPQIKPDTAGVYHYSNADTWCGGISWYTFACEIMNLSKLDCVVNPIPTELYPTRAVRPRYSVLDTTKIQQTFGIKIPDWKNALKRCITELQRQ